MNTFSIEIRTYRRGIILLLDPDYNRAVRLFVFLKDLVLGSCFFKRSLVLLYLLPDKPDSLIVRGVLLQHKMQSLTDTRFFDPFH